jgi:hypothetical protein
MDAKNADTSTQAQAGSTPAKYSQPEATMPATATSNAATPSALWWRSSGQRPRSSAPARRTSALMIGGGQRDRLAWRIGVNLGFGGVEHAGSVGDFAPARISGAANHLSRAAVFSAWFWCALDAWSLLDRMRHPPCPNAPSPAP